jgi:acetyltransferase-like isoleucine patch superfamily enzyme
LKGVFLRRDHRPYFVKKLYLDFERLYTNHFLRPQLESLGKGFHFLRPWYIKIYGSPIEIGICINMAAAPDSNVRLTVWPNRGDDGRIKIGNYCLICPGTRISAASEIVIGDNCMMANGVYLTDSDWHDIYDRTSTGRPAPITIENNVWLGDGVTVCKGVTVGENSIIGARAVVTNNIPPNTIAAGNPAREIRQLDPEREITVRSQWFKKPELLFEYFDTVNRDELKQNTLLHWLRYLLFPGKND